MKWIIFILLTVVGLFSCNKEAEIQPKDYPYVVTKEVIDIDSTGATFSAEVLDYGTEKIIDFGFIWSNNEKEYQKSLFEEGEALKSFTYRTSTDLDKNEIYSCKAYIRTKTYLIFGNVVSFQGLGSTSPEILEMNPNIGFDGTIITLKGEYLSTDSLENKVYVNNIEANVKRSNSDSIVFVIPQMEETGNVDIYVKTGENRISQAKVFFIKGPQINSISKTSAHSGEFLTILGDNFIQNGERIEVFFGSLKATIIDTSEARLEVIVPHPTCDKLLIDDTQKIQLINGLKAAEFGQEFTIKKSWSRKQALYESFNIYWDNSSFSYQGNGYIFECNSGDLYQYNPTSDSWGIYSSFPGTRREGSLLVSINDKLLKIGGEFDWPEFWEFDFTTQTWNQKNYLPLSFKWAAYFVLNSEVYIINQDWQVWKYNLISENFERMNDLPETSKSGYVRAFSNGQDCYVLSNERTWKYDHSNDSWQKKASSPSAGDNLGDYQSFVLNGTGYIFFRDYLYKYYALQDKWVLVSIYPGVSYGHSPTRVAFIIGDKVYIATISDHSGQGTDMYCYQEN